MTSIRFNTMKDRALGLLFVMLFSNVNIAFAEIANNVTNPKLNLSKSTAPIISVKDLYRLSALGTFISIYEDEGRQKNVEEIIKLNNSEWQTTNSDIPTLLYSTSAFWLHLVVDNDSEDKTNLLLSIENSNLDDIQIYIQHNDIIDPVIQVGDHYPFNQRKVTNRFFITPVKIESLNQVEIYIRIINMGSLQFPIYLKNQSDYALDVQFSSLLWGVYFGLTLIMALYNFVLFLSVKDRSYLLFSLFIFSNMIFHACLHGFGFQFIWPESEGINEWGMYVSNAFLYIFGGLFISEFVNLKKLSIIQYRVMSTIVLTSLFFIIVSPWNSYQFSVLVMTGMAFPFAFASIGASLTALLRGNKAARFFLVSWVIFIAAAFTLAASKMGFVPRNFLTENGLQIGNALSILFISLALADNINIEKKQRMASDQETLRLEREARSNKEKQFELALQTKEAELKAQGEIITAREEVLLAKAKSKTKSSFLATMSHEIRTPLNGILGMSGMLSETTLTDKQRGFLDIITNSGRSLLNIVNDILDFSKIEAGKMEMEYRVFDVYQLHRETIRNFELLAKDKSIQLLCEIDKNVPQYIKSDSNRLQQVLLNLLGNALKFTEKGNICLRVSSPKNSNIIKTEVIDSGIGLTKKQQSKLFHSFSQADGSTTRKYGGTGLGLSISKNIIELLDGKIGVISEENQGANFWFYIPSQPMTDDEIRAFKNTQNPRLNQQKQEEARSKLEGLSVLVAEDNKVNQMVIKRMVSNLGMKCYLAENGEEALEHVKSYYEEIDAVLMDCEMPVMDGYQATQEIRKWEVAEGKKSLPILAVTAHALEEMVQDSYDAGMNGHISKPIDRQLLADELVKFL